jgi:tRNA threonylcarbamoyladenosine biosynthesis protein TsaB
MNESWLILETSGRPARIGLARGGAVVRSAALDETRRHARDLASTVEAMLKAEGIAPRELTGVMVGRGPGSYTGLRVGLMSAKALAFATGCRLVAVDTFAAIAEQGPAEAQVAMVFADALQNQVYAQRFNRLGDAWVPMRDLAITSADLLVNLPSVPEAAAVWWVTGPGVSRYADRIPPGCPCMIAPETDREPRVESVFAVGSRLTPLTREELFALEPLYLRGSSAEEKAKQTGGPRQE